MDVELKSLVSRIRNRATNIRDRVKKQKELSESMIDEDALSESLHYNAPGGVMLPQILKDINDTIEISDTIATNKDSKL